MSLLTRKVIHVIYYHAFGMLMFFLCLLCFLSPITILLNEVGCSIVTVRQTYFTCLKRSMPSLCLCFTLLTILCLHCS